MSKSKSRHPSRQISDKTPARVNEAVKADLATTEKPVSTSSSASSTAAATATRPAQAGSKALSRDAAKYERRQTERQQRYLTQRRRRRTRNSIIAAILTVVVVGGGLTGFLIYQSQHLSKQAHAAVAPYQEAVYDSNYPPIDDLYCDASEGQVTHIHAHLSIWIDGQASPLPQYIGIAQSANSTGGSSADCLYWLHTHNTDGVIHIESPASADETFTLGQFVDEWNQGFSSLGFPSQLLLNTGWTIWINGKIYHGTLDSIPLTAHALITIAYNSPRAKPDTSYAWNGL